MDIFNRKQVEELEAEVKRLRGVEQERDGYKRELLRTEEELKRVIKIKDTIPDGCTPGSYCQACEFVKPYYYNNYIYGRLLYGTSHNTTITGYICGKGDVCKNFTQKEIEKK